MIRTVRIGTALFAVVFAASGCGFVDAMAHPGEQTSEASGPAPATSSPADPDGPVQVVVADLADSGPGDLQLVVTVGRVITGEVLPFPQFSEDCPVNGPTMQYVPVTFELTADGGLLDGLAAHLTVTRGPATPGDVGDVGVFFEPSAGHDAYCADYPPLPRTDTFWSHGGPSAVTGYVVLPQAVTPATPQGRPEVFPTLQARIDTIRLRDAVTGEEEALRPGAVRTGALCPDDADAFCIPLG